jgi:hypothetical protein
MIKKEDFVFLFLQKTLAKKFYYHHNEMQCIMMIVDIYLVVGKSYARANR